MVTKRTPGIPEQDCKPKASEMSLEELQNIFLSPPKFVVGTTASEAAYRVMISFPNGLTGFWEDAIRSFNNGSLESLVMAAAAFEEERKRGRHTAGVRSANGRVSRELLDRVIELEQALSAVKRMSRSKVMAGLAKLHLERHGLWTYPLYL